MAKTLVIDDAEQTLTNKTINGVNIEIDSVSDGQVLAYDETSGKFKNATGGYIKTYSLSGLKNNKMLLVF
jgi:hypothetical protein